MQWIGLKSTAASVSRGVKNSWQCCWHLRWEAVLAEPFCSSTAGGWAQTWTGLNHTIWARSCSPGLIPICASQADAVSKHHYQEGVLHTQSWTAIRCNHEELKGQLKRDTRDMLERTVWNYKEVYSVYLSVVSVLCFCFVLSFSLEGFILHCSTLEGLFCIASPCKTWVVYCFSASGSGSEEGW